MPDLLHLTERQIRAAYEAGMDDAELTSQSGQDRRLESPRWIWRRVLDDEPIDAYEPSSVVGLAHRYQAGYLDYW